MSNHGGRILDTQSTTIDALPAIAGALKGRVPVLLDGGIRRGSDRPSRWPLGCHGIDRPSEPELYRAVDSPALTRYLRCLKGLERSGELPSVCIARSAQLDGSGSSARWVTQYQVFSRAVLDRANPCAVGVPSGPLLSHSLLDRAGSFAMNIA